MANKPIRRPGKKLIFVRWVTIKGRRVYASQYGKRAFPIWVSE